MQGSKSTADLSVDLPSVKQNISKVPSTQGAPKAQSTTRWQRIAFDLIVALSAFVNLFHLGQNIGNVNPYYAAAIKSMLINGHNFFFVAFDPGGFLAVEKPPLGLWIQAASVELLGFSAWSLLLPQALAGIGSVIVLYLLIRRIYGSMPALLAALALALMPISVVTARDNTIDSLLVLTLLFATWSLSLAVEKGSLRWLLLSALLVGLGFNIKFLEAYVVLPAFTITYLIGAPRQFSVRIGHLALAGVVLLVVSFFWITIVDMVPASQRPYIISTQTNSELEVALGRTGTQPLQSTVSNEALTLSARANTGEEGPLRLFNSQLGGQVSWLIFFAICALLVMWKWKRPLWPISSYQQGFLLWGIWFVVLLIFFSFALFYHPYYTVTFAPAICALVGCGGVEMYRAYRENTGWRSRLLPVALIGTALVQMSILSAFPDWSTPLTPLIVGLSILVAMLLIIARFQPRLSTKMVNGPIATAGILVLLIAPTVWSVIPLVSGNDAVNPTAGPTQPSLLGLFLPPEVPHAQPQLTSYLLRNQGQAQYLIATPSAPAASPFILDTGKPAIAFGGYTGLEQIITVQQVVTMIRQGQVRFFLLPYLSAFGHIPVNKFPPDIRQPIQDILQAYTSNGKTATAENTLLQWIANNCALVPRSVAEPGSPGTQNTVDLDTRHRYQMRLFDCVRAAA